MKKLFVFWLVMIALWAIASPALAGDAYNFSSSGNFVSHETNIALFLSIGSDTKDTSYVVYGSKVNDQGEVPIDLSGGTIQGRKGEIVRLSIFPLGIQKKKDYELFYTTHALFNDDCMNRIEIDLDKGGVFDVPIDWNGFQQIGIAAKAKGAKHKYIRAAFIKIGIGKSDVTTYASIGVFGGDVSNEYSSAYSNNTGNGNWDKLSQFANDVVAKDANQDAKIENLESWASKLTQPAATNTTKPAKIGYEIRVVNADSRPYVGPFTIEFSDSEGVHAFARNNSIVKMAGADPGSYQVRVTVSGSTPSAWQPFSPENGKIYLISVGGTK